MAIRRYRVTEPSSLEDLRECVHTADRNGQYLTVTAVPIPDELSQRRGPAAPETFVFRVTDIHTDPEDYSVIVQNTDTNEWSMIVVQDDTISFSVVN